MNKRIRTGLVSTALVAGSFIGAGVVSAQVDDTVPADTDEQPADEQPADEVPADEVPADQAPAEDEAGDRAEHRAEHRADRAERRADRVERRTARAEATADLLGIEVDELRAAFEGGLTLADVAEANGVDVQTIIDAKVTELTERINDAVDSERLTADEAADKLADLEERVTTRVNEGLPERGERGGRGHHGQATDEAAADEEAG